MPVLNLWPCIKLASEDVPGCSWSSCPFQITEISKEVVIQKEALKVQKAILASSEKEALCDWMTVLLLRKEVLALRQGWVIEPTERTARIQAGIVCCIPLGKAPKNMSLLQPSAVTELVLTQVHRCGVAILCYTCSWCDHRGSEDTGSVSTLQFCNLKP